MTTKHPEYLEDHAICLYGVSISTEDDAVYTGQKVLMMYLPVIVDFMWLPSDVHFPVTAFLSYTIFAMLIIRLLSTYIFQPAWLFTAGLYPSFI